MHVEDVCEITPDLLYLKIWEKVSKDSFLFSRKITQSKTISYKVKKVYLWYGIEIGKL